jgi:hypothetical protein
VSKQKEREDGRKRKFARYDEGEERIDRRREQCAGRVRYGIWEARGVYTIRTNGCETKCSNNPKKEIVPKRARKKKGRRSARGRDAYLSLRRRTRAKSRGRERAAPVRELLRTRARVGALKEAAFLAQLRVVVSKGEEGGRRNATYHLPRDQITPPPRTRIDRAAIETPPPRTPPPSLVAAARPHHHSHPSAPAARPTRGRGHRRAEDGAAMRNGERLRRVLRMRVVVPAIRVRVVLRVCARWRWAGRRGSMRRRYAGVSLSLTSIPIQICHVLHSPRKEPGVYEVLIHHRSSDQRTTVIYQDL